MKKLLLYIRTLRYLKPIQIYYRVYNAIKSKLFSHNYSILKNRNHQYPNWSNATLRPFIPPPSSLTSPYSYLDSTSSFTFTFTFLNQHYTFQNIIDWNYNGYKKLWTYNLNYFDYLLQESITKEVGLQLIHQYIADFNWVKEGKEPYPTSLRIINWVKFCLKHNIQVQMINAAIHNQTISLSKNLEYHILANHLLENAFAFTIGSAYTGDDIKFKKATRLLNKQLKEQILPDGAHYESSPMYHQIILSRLLDTYNILSASGKQAVLVQNLKDYASLMLGWTLKISHYNTYLPLFKDAANGIAPDTIALKDYAERLLVNAHSKPLNESGYRKFVFDSYELLLDIGNISPSFQPGHAHADHLSFELYVFGCPIVVDTGTSTYNPNDRRIFERSTTAHNTVSFCEKDSSEMWASHRVGRRARVKLLTDEQNLILANHDGFAHLGVIHQRSIMFYDKELIIEDEMLSLSKAKARKCLSVARIHFHPDRMVRLVNNKIFIDNYLIINIIDSQETTMADYLYAPEFNKLVPAKVCEIKFDQKLITKIETKSKI